MLLLNAFYDRKRYISPEDEIQIYYDVNDLFKIWKNIILNYSNYRITDLTRENQDELNKIIPYLNDIHLDKNRGLSPQLDRKIVEIILWGSSNFVTQSALIDEIFRKTKSSMFQYFHHDLIVNAYLNINAIDSALRVIDSMVKKDHTAYFYSVLKYNPTIYGNKKFSQGLQMYQNQVIVKLLSKGERVSLNNVSFEDLNGLVNEVKKMLN